MGQKLRIIILLVDKVAYQAAYVSTVMSSFHASTAHEGVQFLFDLRETARPCRDVDPIVLALLALLPT